MAFSERTSQGDVANALSNAIADVRAGGGSLLDLTVSNPTTAGVAYERDAIVSALATTASLVYSPDALGAESARETVAREGFSIAIASERVALTASTSEAYAVLFKMLCDPGDEILAPAPSYPLLSWLSSFEAVRIESYPLVHAGSWHVDIESLKALVTPKTRAIVVVSPNNPTGSYLGAGELEAMLDLGLPIVCDEVFAPYALGAETPPTGRVPSALVSTRGLVFALSGLSKLVGLPQMKLGWIGVGGDDRLAAAAMDRLATVLDAYLSVSTVQHAVGPLLSAGRATREAIRTRTRRNLAAVRTMASAASSVSLLDVEGGWYATLRVPETRGERSDEQWVVDLARRDGVLVHPGYFFDFPRGAYLVVSLLTPEAELDEGLRRIANRVANGP